jgi:general secretion pathway protein G
MKHPQSIARRRAGFTLAEMMVVIVILGLLATLVVTNVMKNLGQAMGGKVKTDIITIESALDNYAINNSMKYPDSLEPLITPDVNGQAYLQLSSIPKDPWKNEYQYEPPGPGQPRPRVYTLGKDMQPGGEGDDRDIDNLMIRNGDIESAEPK